MFLHLFVEAFQVGLDPISPARVPLMTWMDPGVVAVKVFLILLRRIVLVDQNWRMLPLIHCLANPVPIRPPSLRENKYHRMAIIGHIGLVPGSVGANISPVGLIEGFKRVISGVPVIFLSFVVHQAHMEMVFARNLLQ